MPNANPTGHLRDLLLKHGMHYVAEDRIRLYLPEIVEVLAKDREEYAREKVNIALDSILFDSKLCQQMREHAEKKAFPNS